MRDCKNCRYYNIYVTGLDEYPQCTAICTCLKGHWENGDPDDTDYSYWQDCKDFQIKPIPKEQWENCSFCGNEGQYPEHDPGCDGSCNWCPVPVQCEFCWSNPKSVFNQSQLVEHLEPEEK